MLDKVKIFKILYFACIIYTGIAFQTVFYDLTMGLILLASGDAILLFLAKKYQPLVTTDERGEKIFEKALSQATQIYVFCIIIAVAIFAVLNLLDLELYEQVGLIILTLAIGAVILSALFIACFVYYRKKM
ncbi:MAG: hypothetical protein RBG13Loki_3022 [Promethearchaeota archaeon CR_4]|nr:MAG: hypothetical protein RBG13Loki_3022 [Candidatus Lokiarchaeota archaeon CR_4]